MLWQETEPSSSREHTLRLKTRLSSWAVDAGSGRAPISVVEAADLWDGGNATFRRQFSCPWSRCISPEGEVGPRLVVVLDVAFENSPQMVLPENDHVVEAFLPH